MVAHLSQTSSSPSTTRTNVPKLHCFRKALTWIGFFSYSASSHVAAPSLRFPHRQPTNATTTDRALLGGIRLERTTYKLPRAVERHLADWDEAFADEAATGLPVFWHVLKSGGTTMKLMYAQCYHLVEACETGALIDAEQQERERIDASQQQRDPSSSEGTQRLGQWPQSRLDAASDPQRRLETDSRWENRLRVVVSEDGRRYANVDITTLEGIRDASRRGFALSNSTDVMFTPLLPESAALLLDENVRGRMFSIFRHPVERVVSIFYYLQGATWEPTYNPEYAQWTLDDYARSPHCESNWMVRSLTNKMTGPLSGEHFQIARELVQRKCLVGLMEGMEESVARFHTFLRLGDGDALQCALQRFAGKGRASNSHRHPALDQASETWAVLARKNQLDIRLYEYAQQLFEKQGKWLKKQRLV